MRYWEAQGQPEGFASRGNEARAAQAGADAAEAEAVQPETAASAARKLSVLVEDLQNLLSFVQGAENLACDVHVVRAALVFYLERVRNGLKERDYQECVNWDDLDLFLTRIEEEQQNRWDASSNPDHSPPGTPRAGASRTSSHHSAGGGPEGSATPRSRSPRAPI